MFGSRAIPITMSPKENFLNSLHNVSMNNNYLSGFDRFDSLTGFDRFDSLTGFDRFNYTKNSVFCDLEDFQKK